MSDIVKIRTEDQVDRCQGNDARGQCINEAMTGASNCLLHGGNKQVDKLEREKLDMYRLGKYQERVRGFKGHNAVKSLRDEVAITRMLLEERITTCKDDMELMMNAPGISALVLTVEKLVTSAHKLEGSLNEHLDKSAILQFANLVIEILIEECPDEATIKAISDRIAKAVAEAGEETE